MRSDCPSSLLTCYFYFTMQRYQLKWRQSDDHVKRYFHLGSLKRSPCITIRTFSTNDFKVFNCFFLLLLIFLSNRQLHYRRIDCCSH